MRNCKAQTGTFASEIGGRNELGMLYRKIVLLVDVMDASAELSMMPSGADLSGEPNLMGAIDGADGEIEQTGDGFAVCETAAELVLDTAWALALPLRSVLDHSPAAPI